MGFYFVRPIMLILEFCGLELVVLIPPPGFEPGSPANHNFFRFLVIAKAMAKLFY